MKIIRFDDIANTAFSSLFLGREHGANVSFFVITSNARGEGPDPHRHPYEETFVVLDGTTDFTVDGATVTAAAGTIIVVPAGVVHSFKTATDDLTRQVNIHPVAEMVTEWMD